MGQEKPVAARNSQEEPRGTLRSQGELGGARRSQEATWGPPGLAGLPGGPLAFPWVPLALPGCPWPRKSQKEGQEEPGGVRSSQKKPGGSQEELPGLSSSEISLPRKRCLSQKECQENQGELKEIMARKEARKEYKQQTKYKLK